MRSTRRACGAFSTSTVERGLANRTLSLTAATFSTPFLATTPSRSLAYSGVLSTNHFLLSLDYPSSVSKSRSYSTVTDVQQLVSSLEASGKKINEALGQEVKRITASIDSNTDVGSLDKLASALLSKPKSLNSAHLEKLLDAYVHHNEVKKAAAFADSLRYTKDFTPSHATNSSMAKLYAKNACFRITSRILKDMIIAGQSPISVADATEIAKCSKTQADVFVLGQIWNLFRERNIIGDTEFYNAMIWGALNSGRPSKTIFYFGQVETFTRDVKWNSKSYAALLQACGQVDRKDLIERWMRRIKNRGLEVDSTVLSGYLAGMTAVGDDEQAMKKLEEMERGRNIAAVEFDSYQSFITGCSLSGNIDKAWAGVRKMKTKGFAPTEETYNVIIKGCLKAQRLRDVDEALTRMTEQGLKPNLETFNLVLSLCGVQKDLNKAEQVLQVLQDQGLEPDTFTYKALIDACFNYTTALREGDPYRPSLDEDVQKVFNKAEEYFAQMVEQGIPPSSDTFYHMLNLSVKSKDSGKTLYYYNLAKQYGVKLTTDIVHALSEVTYQAMLAKKLL